MTRILQYQKIINQVTGYITLCTTYAQIMLISWLNAFYKEAIESVPKVGSCENTNEAKFYSKNSKIVSLQYATPSW